MSKQVKTEYSTEFKERTLNMVIRSDKHTSQIARELDINISTLYAWVNKAKSGQAEESELNTEELFDELQPRISQKKVNDALLSAIWKRKPGKGLLWHTDRGSQYASFNHR